jgi:acetylornithine deacetylase/succinyl-diaminopimelate desuccinylase-like protein
VDDKGQVYLHLKAVEAHLAENGALPVNVVFLVEGEEEVGSPNLVSFLRENAERLRCDAVLISDTPCSPRGCPPSPPDCAGWRTWRCGCRAPRCDLHSGSTAAPW